MHCTRPTCHLDAKVLVHQQIGALHCKHASTAWACVWVEAKQTPGCCSTLAGHTWPSGSPSRWMMLRLCRYSSPAAASTAMASRRRHVSWAAAAACSRPAARQSYRLPWLQYSAREVGWAARWSGGLLAVPASVQHTSQPQCPRAPTCDQSRGHRHQPHELDNAAWGEARKWFVVQQSQQQRWQAAAVLHAKTGTTQPAHLGWRMRLITAASACSSCNTRSGSCSWPLAMSSAALTVRRFTHRSHQCFLRRHSLQSPPPGLCRTHNSHRAHLCKSAP